MPGEALRDEFGPVLEPADEELEGVDQARPGAIEHLVSIDDGDAALAHGGEIMPPRLRREMACAGETLIEREAAWRDDEVGRGGGGELCD